MGDASEKRPSHSSEVAAVAARPRGAVWLHWVTLLPLLMAYVAIVGRGELEDRAWRTALLWVHQCSGAAVFGLALARLAVRWQAGPWAPVAARQRLDQVAVAVHAVLYLAMLGVPLLGWALSSALGHPPPWQTAMPGISEDEDLADRLSNWHGTAAWTWALLIGLHVAAALYHHFVLRDDVLRAMRPRAAAAASTGRRPLH